MGRFDFADRFGLDDADRYRRFAQQFFFARAGHRYFGQRCGCRDGLCASMLRAKHRQHRRRQNTHSNRGFDMNPLKHLQHEIPRLLRASARRPRVAFVP